jgi:hypothetical protein
MVTTTTSGSDWDTDGYLVQVDGGQSHPIGVNASITLEEVSAGPHGIELTGLATNCTAASGTVTVNVPAGAQGAADFDVVCTAFPTTGAVNVTVATSGGDPDPDGYLLKLDGDAGRPVAASASLTLADLAGGTHQLELSDVAANCVVPDNPQTVEVVIGQAATVTFQVTCVGQSAPEIASGRTVRDADGGHLITIAPAGFSAPSWSPLGTGSPGDPYHIGFDTGIGSSIQVVPVTLVGGVPVGGTPVVLVAEGNLPAWSPDGREIAYIRSDTAVRVVRSDGTNDHLVAVAETTAIFTRVTWRRDGLTLAWIEDAENLSGDPIRRIKASTRQSPGSTSWAAQRTLFVVGRTPGGLSSLTWGNTGDSLLFAFGDTQEVAVLDLTGGSPTVTRLFHGLRPVWSPDDSAILFVDPTTRNPQLRIFTIATGATVAAGPSDGERPDWRRAPGP